MRAYATCRGKTCGRAVVHNTVPICHLILPIPPIVVVLLFVTKWNERGKKRKASAVHGFRQLTGQENLYFDELFVINVS